MKKIFFIAIILFLKISGLAQSVSPDDLNMQVRGIFFYENLSYLITEKGFIQLPDEEINSQFQEYYRKVYNDSTIVNPNTILSSGDDSQILLYILPFVNVSELGDNLIALPEEFQLNNFLQQDTSGKLEYRKGVSSMVEKIIRGRKEK